MIQTPSGAGSEPEVGFYEIRLRGHLAPRWATRLEVMSLANESDGTTTIRARAVDQAALHGLLDKIRDLGLTLISVAAVDGTDPDETPIVAQ
jgi:hypothetical protein